MRQGRPWLNPDFTIYNLVQDDKSYKWKNMFLTGEAAAVSGILLAFYIHVTFCLPGGKYQYTSTPLYKELDCLTGL